MGNIQISRFRARYHLPESRRDERIVLDRVMRQVMDQALEHAVERAGVSSGELVCIRRIHVPVRLRLSASEPRLASEWSMALAESIRSQIEAGDGREVVRYRSRFEALLDFALAGSGGRVDKAWAWRRIGLAPVSSRHSSTAAAELLPLALRRTPQWIVPALVALARVGRLGGLVHALRPPQWVSLAEAALQTAGISLSQPLDSFSASPRAWDSQAGRMAGRLLKRSALAAWGGRMSDPRLRLAFAVLSLLEADPGSLHLPRRQTRRLISAAVSRLAAAASENGRPDRRDFQLNPSAGSPTDASRDESRVAAPGDRPTPRQWDSGSEPLKGRAAEMSSGHSLDDDSTVHQRVAHQPAREGRQAVESLRESGSTNNGGLLYLTHLFDAIDLPRTLLECKPLRDRSLRWSLYQLGLRLTSAGEGDAAVLALAGLTPLSSPPDAGEPPIRPRESRQLETCATLVLEALEEALEGVETEGRALLDWVCRRRAELLADPGWIEVRFSLDEVSTRIRRVGLDLDPGYVPWMGLVMRFVYA